MLTREEAKEKLWSNGHSDSNWIIDKIYDEHEEQLKEAYIDGSNSTNELIQSLYKQQRCGEGKQQRRGVGKPQRCGSLHHSTVSCSVGLDHRPFWSLSVSIALATYSLSG